MAGRSAAAQAVNPEPSPQRAMPGSTRDLQAKVERLRQVVDAMGTEQLEQLRAESRRLEDAIPRLRYEEGALQAALASLRAEVSQLTVLRSQAASLRSELPHPSLPYWCET